MGRWQEVLKGPERQTERLAPDVEATATTSLLHFRARHCLLLPALRACLHSHLKKPNKNKTPTLPSALLFNRKEATYSQTEVGTDLGEVALTSPGRPR